MEDVVPSDDPIAPTTRQPVPCTEASVSSIHSTEMIGCTWEVTLGNKGEGGNNQVLQKNTLYYLRRICNYHNGRWS